MAIFIQSILTIPEGIQAAMSGQSFASMGTAALLVGHEHVMRINPTVAPGRFSLDDVSGVGHLQAFGYEEARYAMPRLRERFLATIAPAYKPCHSCKTNDN